MKKKIFALCMVVCLAVVAVAGASLAYFTDTDEADNTFTLGRVKIALHEGAYANVQKNGAPIDSDGNVDVSKANPNAHKDEENFGYDYLDESYQTWLAEQTLMPGTQGFNRIQKRVFVENTGKHDAYVRVIIGIPTELDATSASDNILHCNQVIGEVNNELGSWIEHGEYAFSQDGYNYYIYYYTEKLPAGEATNAEVISYFWLDNKVDCDDNGYYVVAEDGSKTYLESIVDGQIVIPVYAEAIQADGFDTYTDAFNAYGDPAFKN